MTFNCDGCLRPVNRPGVTALHYRENLCWECERGPIRLGRWQIDKISAAPNTYRARHLDLEGMPDAPQRDFTSVRAARQWVKAEAVSVARVAL